MTDRMETRLPIPSPVTPPDTVCLQIDVPNSTDHISALWGQIYQLTLWNAWDRDTAHSGKTLAAEWVKALNSLRTCTGEKVRPGIEIEDFMPLRVDCDCNVFVTCCDGTEKQILTGDQVKMLIQSQPGNGTPQPQPGGGCQDYDFSLTGTGQWLLPVPLSTGDTVQITDDIGATNIVGTIDWNCPDGFIYFAGNCVGSANHDPSNRVPAAPTGSVILLLNGTYYDLSSTFTVPGGISNVQGTLLLNYPSGSGINGSVSGGVRVCNNAPTTWSHTFDFTLSDNGFVAVVIPGGATAGHFVAGTGLVSDVSYDTSDAESFRRVYMHLSGIVPFNVQTAQILYDYTLGSFSITNQYGAHVFTQGGGTNDIIAFLHADTPTGTNKTLVGASAGTAQTVVGIEVACGSVLGVGDPGGTVTIKSLTITGSGPNPF